MLKKKWFQKGLKFLILHPIIIIPFVFYGYTAAPTIGLGDTALLVDGVKNWQINSHVNNHNITVLFGILFSFLPLENIAYKITLVSVFLGALTIVLFYFLMLYIFKSKVTAIIVALVLMVSHSMWWHSSLLEVYAVNAFFTVITLWLLTILQQNYCNKYLYYLFFVAGLAIFNHVQLGFILIGSIVFVTGKIITLIKENKEYLKLFFKCIFCFILGFLPYLITLFKDIYINKNLWQTLKWASGGDFQGIMLKGEQIYAWNDLSYLIIKQFPSFFLIMIIWGTFVFVLRWQLSLSFWSLITMFALNTYFFMFYQTWDKFAFLLPSFIILAFWGAFGLDELRKWLETRNIFWQIIGIILSIVSLIFPIYFYSHLSKWAKENPQSIWYIRYNNDYTKNSHNTSEYIANPNKRNYYDIEKYALLLFNKLPQNAIYIDDDSRTYYPLEYYQKYYQYRPDLNIEIINSWGFNNWGLNQQNFATLVQNAYQNNLNLFLITTDYPFINFIQELPPQMRSFQKITLDNKHWIYKLNTIKDLNNSTSENYFPIVKNMIVGINLNEDYSLEKNNFNTAEPIMVKLLFQKNSAPFFINFRWLTPSGKIYYVSQPFLVSINNTSVWSFLEKQEQLLPGIWRVEALSNGKILYTINFQIN